jgi:hypothetical protein
VPMRLIQRSKQKLELTPTCRHDLASADRHREYVRIGKDSAVSFAANRIGEEWYRCSSLKQALLSAMLLAPTLPPLVRPG